MICCQDAGMLWPGKRVHYLEDGLPVDGSVVIGSAPFISHGVRPFGRGPHNPILKGRTRSPWL